jgi:hypothetical protein
MMQQSSKQDLTTCPYLCSGLRFVLTFIVYTSHVCNDACVFVFLISKGEAFGLIFEKAEAQ